VLVVEDEGMVRTSISHHLRDCGFSVIEAQSAAEALVVFSAEAFVIDVLFTDVHLPGEMNGLGLARWVRSNRPGVKIILTSGVDGMAEEAGDLCADGPLMRKPCPDNEVERRVKQLLA
jgi:CheY-like chemotaxis protein